jgi:CubicO group peptidase (beta-lactamase class C family)
VYYNFADIQDHKIFPARALHKSAIEFRFTETNGALTPASIEGLPFEQFLVKNKTVAFLIIKNDSIYYEKYFKGYENTSIVPPFSMAKSILFILIGCAIDEGLIKSVNDPVTDYIPELKKNGFGKVTVKHLLQMTSGAKFNESYINPFGDAAALYYGLNLEKLILNRKLKHEPGSRFEYVSGNSQVLGFVLARALKEKTVTEYLQEKIWTPLGMEYDASWSLDKKRNGMEKTFCCINARTRDYAKIGRLYQNKGNWNGKQIVSENWVEESTKRDTSAGSWVHYQYQWWLPSTRNDFMAQGILGQFIYVNPAKNLIIVRLGKSEGKANWWKTFRMLSAFY